MEMLVGTSGNVGRHKDKTHVKSWWEMLVGTPVSLQIKTKDIGNVCRHTLIFGDND